MQSFPIEEVDFVVINEDYSRYLVHDGSILKVKIVVRKILFAAQRTPEGYPAAVNVDAINIATAIVPPGNRREPSVEPFDATKDKGEEKRFEEQEVKKQEYMTTNGFRVTIKPVLTKVFRYEKFNNFGEPIYTTAMQSIINIDKITNTAT
jgi:hypothetical protein